MRSAGKNRPAEKSFRLESEHAEIAHDEIGPAIARRVHTGCSVMVAARVGNRGLAALTADEGRPICFGECFNGGNRPARWGLSASPIRRRVLWRNRTGE